MSEDRGNDQPHIKGVVDRIEDSKVVIRLETGVELLWPQARISNLREGTSVRLLIQTETDAKLNREELAKSILNEILKPATETKNHV